jgi:hypothetical protein
VCPTETQAVAWIQDFLEQVCKEVGERVRGETKAGPGLPIGEGKDKSQSSRDGENIVKDKEEPIWDVIREDQLPTE